MRSLLLELPKCAQSACFHIFLSRQPKDLPHHIRWISKLEKKTEESFSDTLG